jgi:hypothetical protein
MISKREMDWKPLDMEHLQEDILVGDYEWQVFDWCWGNVIPKNIFGMLKNQKNGLYKYRYRPKPKKESVEEAAERMFQEYYGNNYGHVDKSDYLMGFFDHAQWQKEQG